MDRVSPSSARLPESLRCKEVKQVEELLQVVLERSAGEEQLVLKRVIIQHSEKLHRKLRVRT